MGGLAPRGQDPSPGGIDHAALDGTAGAAAHDDGLAGHWRLRVNGVIAGSAARRDGALELLRALEGAETVYYDPKRNGVRPCPVRALISAFEAPTLPLVGPCPEHAAGIPSGH